jgi:hypothetical protein
MRARAEASQAVVDVGQFALDMAGGGAELPEHVLLIEELLGEENPPQHGCAGRMEATVASAT